MFYAKWFVQVLLIVVLIALVGLLVPPPMVAAGVLGVATIWAIWLLASLAWHLVHQPEVRGTPDA